MTAANCEKHPFELAETACYDCGHDACKTCLVSARGPKKPPICLDCSITAAGVRRTSARPPKYIGKDMKVLRKRLTREFKERRAAASRLVDFDQIPPFDPATDTPPDEAPFEPIAEPAFEPLPEPAFEPIAEPAFEPLPEPVAETSGEQSLDERLAGSLPPPPVQPPIDAPPEPAFASATEAPPAFETQDDFFDTPAPTPVSALPPPPADTHVPLDTQADFFDTPAPTAASALPPPPADTHVPFDTQADFFDTPAPTAASAPEGAGAPGDTSREQMPTMDWSQEFTDDWNTPPVATGN